MKEITTLRLKKLIASREPFRFLDCRGVDYYHWEHIPGATNLRWKYVKERAPQILKDKQVLIITSCDGFTCNASVRCFENLKQMGYKNLIEYPGGLSDWKAHGYETEESPQYKIAPNVYRFPSQMFYGESVGSYLIEDKDFILLIDGPQILTEEHEDFIAHFDKPIKLFMTHGSTAGEGNKLQKEYRAKIFLHKDDLDNDWLKVKPDVLIEDGFKFSNNLKIIHTPGHSPGSSVLWDSQNKILFTGDHMQGCKGQIYDFVKYDDGHSGYFSERLESVTKLLPYDYDRILSFHYEMILTNAKEAVRKFVQKYANSYR